MTEQTELTVFDRASIALKSSEYEDSLRVLVASTADITVVNSQAGREQAHTAAMVLLKSRTSLVATAKVATEDAKAFTKAVNTEVARLLEISEAEEKRLFALRDVWDEAKAAEKAAKLAAEQQRIATIRAKIDLIRSTPAKWLNKPSAEVGAAADHLSETVISLDEYAEFTGEAQIERDHAVKQMREMQASMVLHEAEQARLAAEREALAKERAEAAERERVAEAAREAQAKKDREALAAREAELAHQERMAAAARQKQEAKDRAERERVEREQREAQERAAAAMRAERDAHEARIAAERAEIARQQAEINAERQRQADEAARVEREKQEAIETAQRIEAEKAEEALRAQQEQAARMQRESEARAEAERLEAARREYVEFEANGPGDVAMVETLAEAYDVSPAVVVNWLAKFDAASFLTPTTMEKAA